jgi:hypothetical protein
VEGGSQQPTLTGTGNTHNKRLIERQRGKEAVLITPPWVGTDSVLTLYFFIHLFIFNPKKWPFY